MKESIRKAGNGNTVETAGDPASIVVIGASRGGTDALMALLSALPEDFSIPVVIAQHRQERSSGLIAILQNCCTLRVVEPDDKDPVRSRHVYVAPAGYHLMIEDRAFGLSLDEVPGSGKPSIDLLFESAAECYGCNTIGIILTGGGRDGALGLARIKQAGGFTIVQDPDSAASSLMPRSAINAAPVDLILNLEGISTFLAEKMNLELRCGGLP